MSFKDCRLGPGKEPLTSAPSWLALRHTRSTHWGQDLAQRPVSHFLSEILGGKSLLWVSWANSESKCPPGRVRPKSWDNPLSLPWEGGGLGRRECSWKFPVSWRGTQNAWMPQLTQEFCTVGCGGSRVTSVMREPDTSAANMVAMEPLGQRRGWLVPSTVNVSARGPRTVCTFPSATISCRNQAGRPSTGWVGTQRRPE